MCVSDLVDDRHSLGRRASLRLGDHRLASGDTYDASLRPDAFREATYLVTKAATYVQDPTARARRTQIEHAVFDLLDQGVPIGLVEPSKRRFSIDRPAGVLKSRMQAIHVASPLRMLRADRTAKPGLQEDAVARR
jgi:hypothetical protein